MWCEATVLSYGALEPTFFGIPDDSRPEPLSGGSSANATRPDIWRPGPRGGDPTVFASSTETLPNLLATVFGRERSMAWFSYLSASRTITYCPLTVPQQRSWYGERFPIPFTGSTASYSMRATDKR